jgi:hypothetical protein
VAASESQATAGKLENFFKRSQKIKCNLFSSIKLNKKTHT